MFVTLVAEPERPPPCERGTRMPSGLPARPVDAACRDARSWKRPLFNSLRLRANLCSFSPAPEAPSQRPNPVTATSAQPRGPRRPGCVSSLTCSAPGVSLVARGDSGAGRVLARLGTALRASHSSLLADRCALSLPRSPGHLRPRVQCTPWSSLTRISASAHATGQRSHASEQH